MLKSITASLGRSLSWYSSIGFVIGLLYGVFYQPQSHFALTHVLPAKEIRLLVRKDAFPEDLFESFKVENNNLLNITYYDDTKNLEEIKGDYDLILVRHVMVPELIKSKSIYRLDESRLSHKNNLSPDFEQLPTDPGAHFSIPVLWGVEKGTNINSALSSRMFDRAELLGPLSIPQPNLIKFFKKEITERQEMPLWIDAFVIPVESKNIDGAYAFMNFILTPDVAHELSAITHVSSTNKMVEGSQLPASLKPSALRSFKLTSLFRQF